MADDDKRQLCGMRDSWRHSLFECSVTRCVWALVNENILDFLQSSAEPNARVWLFSAFDHLPRDSQVTMVVTMWAIWWARRRAIHEGELQSPHATHSFVTNFIAELATIQAGRVTPNDEQHGGPRLAAGQGWRAPEVGSIKIQVDGGVSRNGRRGAAATIGRNHEGFFLGSSAMVFDEINDPPMLEALACREALALARDLYADHIVVACDCKTVVEEIKMGSEGRYNNIIKEIQAQFRDAMCGWENPMIPLSFL
ncbi:uncharacterized protein [Aegilops tauschii subsp. strangulata]|uniref:uncharacterized protein n=1 Tax=Aegilops tauschii subsp. strangulata TaxID=200361 RepID=UPI001ABCD288|nr:uncharacterized protein LOC120973987 [Aegilops tauschii subsp. strangulata]